MGHFFPSYSFDLDRTLYFFSSGRYEPRNKGFDLRLESMAAGSTPSSARTWARRWSSSWCRAGRPRASTRWRWKRGVLDRGLAAEVCQKITEGVGQGLFALPPAGADGCTSTT
jgi:hypothetical protein